MIKSGKAKKLIDYLEERLISGQYSIGTKIPSVRRLADKFQISYGTALHGVNHLCEQGKFEKIPHRGIFVCERPARKNTGKVKRIAVFMEPYVHEVHCGMCYTAFLGMQELALKAGYTFMVNPLMINDASSEIIREMSDGADGIIFLNEYDLFLHEFKMQIPAVGVLMENSFNGMISTVNLDPWSAAHMAVEFFESRGFKKVTIISSCKPVFVTRGRCFATIWREKNYECDMIITHYGTTIEFDQKQAYLFTSDQYGHSYSEKYLKETGIQLSDKHTILGIDGKQLIDPSFHRFPSIAVNWKNIGEIAINECLNRINNPTIVPKNIALTGKKLF